MMTATTATDYWVGRIRPHLEAAAESIIAAGQELLAAKAAVPHGDFGPLLNRLGLNSRTAQRFMAIARHPVLSNATHVSDLPSAWGTLYELARLPGDVVEGAIGSGDVRPSMSREDARALGARTGPVDSRGTEVTNAVGCLTKATEVLERMSDTMSAEDAMRSWGEVVDLARKAQIVAAKLNAEYNRGLAAVGEAPVR